MDPTTTFCPNRNCPARGQTGQGNIGVHSRKEQRFICHACQKTFSATKGTVCYRLRTSAETVVLIVTGCDRSIPKTYAACCSGGAPVTIYPGRTGRGFDAKYR